MRPHPIIDAAFRFMDVDAAGAFFFTENGTSNLSSELLKFARDDSLTAAVEALMSLAKFLHSAKASPRAADQIAGVLERLASRLKQERISRGRTPSTESVVRSIERFARFVEGRGGRRLLEQAKAAPVGQRFNWWSVQVHRDK